jgi:DNA-binding transcriptional MerR regulator
MSYTVKQLANISGVSARTLRFYDEIGLLKPAYYGENNYRYYQQEQLLMLQQILFYRELGFALDDIQSIIQSHDFDRIDALKSHRITLEGSLERTQKLLETIDKTISHIRGRVIMRDVEMYEGFDPIKQQEYEKYLVEKGGLSQKQINESWDNVRGWKKSNWDAFQKEGDDVNLSLVKALDENLKPDSEKVQTIIKRHYQWVTHFWTPTQETYKGLAKMYLEHQDFKDYYAAYHPELVEFIVKAINYYADKNLN